MKRFLLPLIAFVVLLGFLAAGLRLNPREIPSPFIGRAAPSFELAQLHDASATITPADMAGQVWLLNVWASWCAACRVEHPLLVDLARTSVVPIVGLNYKDARPEAIQWLKDLGDPYQTSGWDNSGRVGIDYGVYGVPETFVIDKQGIIRMKHIGPVTRDVLVNKILPLIRELKSA
jgi:cytochrome c biogenesis protein CcmG, thiol:disulfide interchange protein DsbE